MAYSISGDCFSKAMPGYSVSLSQFEGPLDLLLHLISNAKIDIKDIFVSSITDQYLDYMSQMDGLDMDAASEFLAMAATLIEIKSRALLPRPPKPADPDEESPEQELLRRLTEYKAFKDAAERLKLLEDRALDIISRLPDEIASKGSVPDLTGVTAQGLLEAFKRALERIRTQPPAPEPRRIRREVYTVQECMFRILSRVSGGRSVFFEELFDEAPGRDEIVSVFFAMLELIRLERVSVSQAEVYGRIALKARKSNGN